VVSEEPEEDTMPPLPPPAIQPSTAFVPIFNINWSSCPFANVPGLRCYQLYLAETEEERYLKTIFEDNVKFPTFPRHLNGDVIVDHHPDIFQLLLKNLIPISSAMSSRPSLETMLPDFRMANPFG